MDKLGENNFMEKLVEKSGEKLCGKIVWNKWVEKFIKLGRKNWLESYIKKNVWNSCVENSVESCVKSCVEKLGGKSVR